MSFKAAMIGCGMITGLYEDFAAPGTYSHAKAYCRHQGFGDLAFMDVDVQRAEAVAAKVDGKVYTSLDELLGDFRPDVVSVCVPDNLHFDTLAQILKSPVRPSIVFAEKPICDTPEQLRELDLMVARSGTPIIVNHSRRFDSEHRRIRSLIASGVLGPLVRVDVDYYGGWRHLGVHLIDVLQYFFGAPVIPRILDYYCESKYPDDPTLDVRGEIAGAPLRLSGFLEAFYQVFDINLMFQAGQVKLSDFGKRIEVFRKTINKENENVLVADEEYSGAAMMDPMPNAVAVLHAYLSTSNPALIAPYGIAEAAATMQTLWKGSEIYGSRS